MTVTPNEKSIQQMTQIMQKTLKKLYDLAEESGNSSKENMALMVSFTIGLMIQVKEKLNILEDELGCEYARVMYLTIKNNSKAVEKDVQKIVKGEKSISESPAELNINNLNDAVDNLSKKINNEIYNILENIPIALKNEKILLQTLCTAITHILIELSNENLNELIDEFVNNMLAIANNNTDLKTPTTMH